MLQNGGAKLALALSCLLFAIAYPTRPALANDAIIAKARALLEQQQAETAFALLKAEEGALAGNFDFDYLLGIAALDSAQPLEAVFALERAVDLEPDSGPARAELARAYAALGESGNARKEFATLKAMSLPEDVERRIDQYLVAIDVYDQATRTQYRPYVQVGLGFDSNVNSATDVSSVAIPSFNNVRFELAEDSRELDSAIWDLGAGVSFTSPLSTAAGLSLYGGIDLDHRLTLNEADFTSTDAGGQLGLHLRRGNEQFRVGAEAQRLKVDGASVVNADREVGGFNGQWQHAFATHSQLTTFAQFSMVRFPDQRVRNVNRATGGVGYGHQFLNVGGKPVLVVSAFGGNEWAQNELRGGHFGRSFFGGRIGGQIALDEKSVAFASLTIQTSDYDARDPTFLKVREDDFVDLSVGYRYQFNRNWSVTPSFRYNNNSSNLITSDYDRFEGIVTVRNDF